MGRQKPDYDQDWMPKLKVDFSAESSQKEERKAALMQQYYTQDAAEHRLQKEKKTMKTGRKLKRSTAFALAACLALGAISVTAYAVVQHLKLGQHANYILQEEMSPAEREKAMEEFKAQPLPEELAGEVYAKYGKLAETWGDLDEGTYEAGDQKITVKSDNIHIESTESQPKTMADEIARLDEMTKRFGTVAEVKPLLAFDLLEFGYVPTGYELEGYRLFKGDEVEPNFLDSKYLSMDFYKGEDPADSIYVQVRYMDEETGFESGGTENMRKTVINGHDAVIDGRSVDILIGDVMYMIRVSDALPAEEAVKMAESLTAK